MDNYQEGRCQESIGRGRCRQAATTNLKTGEQDRCYYHDKVRSGLTVNADELVILDEEDELV